MTPTECATPPTPTKCATPSHWMCHPYWTCHPLVHGRWQRSRTKYLAFVAKSLVLQFGPIKVLLTLPAKGTRTLRRGHTEPIHAKSALIRARFCTSLASDSFQVEMYLNVAYVIWLVPTSPIIKANFLRWFLLSAFDWLMQTQLRSCFLRNGMSGRTAI